MTESTTEVSIPQALLEKILASTTPDAVLVGGQALAFWVSKYNIELPKQFQVGAISDDADFLGNRGDVVAIAENTRGIAAYAPQHRVTALVGQVRIAISVTEHVNVDVLHSIIGLSADEVRKHASRVTIGETSLWVMHPMDVFRSRIENLAELEEKQNPQGIEQAKLGILVARHFIEEVAGYPDDGQKHALKLIETLAKVAKSGAGYRVQRDYGIDFRAGIPSYAIKNKRFHDIRYPQILVELQPPGELTQGS